MKTRILISTCLFALVLQTSASADDYIVKFRGSEFRPSLLETVSECELNRLETTGSDALLDTIEYVEPNISRSSFLLPNDRLTKIPFEYQWAPFAEPFSGINAPAAWDISTGSSDVVVAVIDSGIDTTHPDLRSNIFRNPGEIPSNGVDDDGNGYIDDVSGYDFVQNDPTPMDEFSIYDEKGHGTHVAGTLGASGNNGIGIAGVSWNVKLVPLRVLDSSGSGTVTNIAKAIYYAVDLKLRRGINLRIINLSFGSAGASQTERNAIQAAANAGIIVVAAAGNQGGDNDSTPIYPASYPINTLVSVTAIGPDGSRPWFANYGSKAVHIAAPGVDILSTIPLWADANNPYRQKQGTSMAAPHVSGILALMTSTNSALKASELKSILLLNVSVRASLSVACASGGAVNAGSAVAAAQTLPKKYSVRGRILSDAGPVAYALVTSSLGTTSSDIDGNFIFEGISEGTNYKLSFQKKGYLFPEGEVSGIVSSDTTLNVPSVAPHYSVRVKIVRETNHSDTVSMTLISSAKGASISTRSTSGRHTVFRNLYEGTYALRMKSSTLVIRPSVIRFSLRKRNAEIRVSASRKVALQNGPRHNP